MDTMYTTAAPFADYCAPSTLRDALDACLNNDYLQTTTSKYTATGSEGCQLAFASHCSQSWDGYCMEYYATPTTLPSVYPAMRGLDPDPALTLGQSMLLNAAILRFFGRGGTVDVPLNPLDPYSPTVPKPVTPMYGAAPRVLSLPPGFTDVQRDPLIQLMLADPKPYTGFLGLLHMHLHANQ